MSPLLSLPMEMESNDFQFWWMMLKNVSTGPFNMGHSLFKNLIVQKILMALLMKPSFEFMTTLNWALLTQVITRDSLSLGLISPYKILKFNVKTRVLKPLIISSEMFEKKKWIVGQIILIKLWTLKPLSNLALGISLQNI